MAWRVAKSLLILRDQLDKLAPNRSKASDGTIGDASHASRHSDHNPWLKDGKTGVVTAMDITHDPAHGMDAYKLAEILGHNGDPRIKYIISNHRIIDFRRVLEWRPYHGANAHDKHTHISVRSNKDLYDSTKPWVLTGLSTHKGIGVIDHA